MKFVLGRVRRSACSGLFAAAMLAHAAIAHAAGEPCKTHLDCSGGEVCPAGACVAPACVRDTDCGANEACDLEGRCQSSVSAPLATSARTEAAPAATAPAATAPASSAEPDRAELQLTVGLAMPAQFTPYIVRHTYTGVGPYVRFEPTARLARHLELGGYVSFSDHPVSEVNHVALVSGAVLLLSGGGEAKLRFDPAAWAVIRVGLSVGVDYVSFPLQTFGGQNESMPGAGLQVGLDADFRAQLTSHLGLVTKIGFLAQPVGTATFPDDALNGKSVSFAFKPAVYVGAGPELFF